MDVLFNCFVIGLVIGIPVWVLMQYLRPRIRLPAFGGGLEAIHIEPVVLDGRFVASAAYALDVAPTVAAITDAPGIDIDLDLETPPAAGALQAAP